MNYSLLVVESVGMMKMATGEGFPPPAGRRNESRLVFGGYRYFLGFFWSKNDLREISGQLDSIWFSFSAILKNKEKTETGTGLLVNRLDPKFI